VGGLALRRHQTFSNWLNGSFKVNLVNQWVGGGAGHGKIWAQELNFLTK
jgi:hypothetical protein